MRSCPPEGKAKWRTRCSTASRRVGPSRPPQWKVSEALRRERERLTSSSFFTGATILCGSWLPPWFRNGQFFRGGIVSPTPNPQPGGRGTTFRLAFTLWFVWHGWLYLGLTLPPACLSVLPGAANFLSTIRRYSCYITLNLWFKLPSNFSLSREGGSEVKIL